MTTKNILPNKELKKIFLNDIISLLSNGKNPSTISKELNVSEQRINYYIKTLKAKGLIKKVSYGTWETTKNLSAVTNEIRGHAFQWVIKLEKRFDWSKLLIDKNIQFRLIPSNKAYRIILNDKKIWLNKKSIVIYDKESYFSTTALESRKIAVYSMIETLNILKNKLNIEFDITDFKVSRHHYSLIKNNLAIQCDKEGKRINIFNKNGLWFTIDNSYNLHEAETLHPETALIDSIGLQNYLNSHKDTNWKVTPQFLLESINQVTNNQLMFAKNLESHVKAMNDISESNKLLQETIKELKEIIKHETFR